MEQINNITEEINNNINVTNKPKKKYKFTEKRKLAYEKMREARKKKIEDMRNRKIEDTEKIPPPPKLKRSRAVDMKQEIIKSSSESSSSTDSSNYESDEKTDKVIIHNYDIKEPESKLIISLKKLIIMLMLVINQKKNINLLKKEN